MNRNHGGARHVRLGIKLRQVAVAAALLLSLGRGTTNLLAGSLPENALLIVDPQDAASLFVANYYKNARNIPDTNVLYMQPDAATWTDHLGYQRPAMDGLLSNRTLTDHIDYVILPPGGEYSLGVQAGLISDSCSPVSQFAVGSAYTMSQIVSTIVSGTPVTTLNHYYGFSATTAIGFDAETYWFGGVPSSAANPSARRYYIGAMLGYDGPNGNTVGQTIAMINRSVAADGMVPAQPGNPPFGTIYYIETSDAARSDPRDPFFDAAVGALTSIGVSAVKLGSPTNNDPLPTGHHDVLGCMTGWANPAIEEADMTILPGAFADHLTSFAGAFGTPSQTKMSEWITKGASGSVGAVQEPCNYPGKFPHPRLHVFYAQGVTLGEAALRSLQYVPFQMLLYGDPLTRPFARIPQVSVSGAPDPDVPVSGMLALTPMATTTQLGAIINRYELLIDGVLRGVIMGTSGTFNIDTSLLADGWHDVRVLARDSTPAAHWGRTTLSIRTDNFGRGVLLAADDLSGTNLTRFDFDLMALDPDVAELRLVQHGRVLAAAAAADSVELPTLGQTLGGGPSRVQAVADFADGTRAVSDPLNIDVVPGATGDANGDLDADLDDWEQAPACVAGPNAATTGECTNDWDADLDGDVDHADLALLLPHFGATAPTPQPPVAYGFTYRFGPENKPALIELPAFDNLGRALTYAVLSNPSQATISGTGPSRLVTPNVGATGSDSMSFRVTASGVDSNDATITLIYNGGA